MDFILNNKKKNISRVACKEPGFNQIEPNVKYENFKLILSRKEFFTLFEDEYNQFVLDMKDEDEKYGERYDEIFETNYALLKDVFFSDKRNLSIIIKDLSLSLISKIVSAYRKKKWEFLIITVDDIIVEDEMVKIMGLAFKR